MPTADRHARPADARIWGAACSECGWVDDTPRTQVAASRAVERHALTCRPDPGWAERAEEAAEAPSLPITYAYA